MDYKKNNKNNFCVFLFFIAFGAHYACAHNAIEREIVIDIPTYNNKDWCIMNLNSVYMQKYTNYTVYITADCPTDGTAEKIAEYIEHLPEEHKKRTVFTCNKFRRGATANHYTVIQQSPDNAIIVQLDGDDFFADDTVLQTVNEMYANPNTWFTYGRYINWPDGELARSLGCFSQPLSRYKELTRRSMQRFVFGPLRTYAAWLAKLIKLEDLIADADPCPGKFYSSASDAALMFPIMEMARKHYIFNQKHVMYIRNIATGINDFKVNNQVQNMCIRLIFGLPLYQPIAGPVYNDSKAVTVGILVLNTHKPAELESFLRALENTKTVDGCGGVVFYVPENSSEKQAYQQCEKDFSRYRFVDVSGANISAAVRENVRNLNVDYVLMTRPDMSFAQCPTVLKCARIMREKRAYTFALADSIDVRGPIEWLEGDIYIRKFGCAQTGTMSPHNVSMSLYAAQDVLDATEKMPTTSIGSFMSAWANITVDGHKIGLFIKKITG